MKNLLYLIEILHQTTTSRGVGLLSQRLYLIEILHQTTTQLSALIVEVSLYLIEILHQTTTAGRRNSARCSLYLIEILHQTTTAGRRNSARCSLYLIEILHQTTTLSPILHTPRSCILLKFYIKPQPGRCKNLHSFVVSYWNSTSNHNSVLHSFSNLSLYLIEILHQTTTPGELSALVLRLYLIEILHQTTTTRRVISMMR